MSLLMLASCGLVLGQNFEKQEFVIDASKPYVFLKFDHVGPRKPIRQGESTTGIWLRVVNNCRIPIVFEGFDGTPGERGVVLLDEVVANETILQIYSSPNSDLQVESEPVPQTSESDRSAIPKTKQEPNGYTSELPGIYRVAPGKELLFSIPRNHISTAWYMRVKFALDLNRSSVSTGPFTYLPYHEADLPKEFQSARVPKTPKIRKTRKNSGTDGTFPTAFKHNARYGGTPGYRVKNDNANMFQLWCAFPDDLLDSRAAEACAELLSEEERARWQRFRPERSRREYLATHALARTALSYYRPVAPRDWRFVTNAYGKPAPTPDCGLRFNLSNSTGLAVCLLVDGPFEVGVDVEARQRADEIAEVEYKVFSAAELAQLDALSATEQPDRYLSLWTLKEAYIKARGMGMALPLREISFLFDDAGAARLEVAEGVDEDAARWRFRQLDYAGHRIAVVGEGTEGWGLELREVRPPTSPAKVVLVG